MAIILHGSRAIGMERKNSDWDILMIFDFSPQKSFEREPIEGEDVEWRAVMWPDILFTDIRDSIGMALQYSIVLWERFDEGSTLLQLAAEEYAKGPIVDQKIIERRLQYLTHKCKSMADDLSNDFMFFRHLNQFVDRSSAWSLEILWNINSQPFYIAFPIIHELDSELFVLFQSMVRGDVPNKKKQLIAQQIVVRLFAAHH